MKVSVVDAPMRPLTRGPSNHFYGYYGKSPWSPSGKLVVGHRTPLFDRMPKPGEEIEVGVFAPGASEGFRTIGRSRAWNLQQGTLAQWFPGHDDEVIYNDIQGEAACAIRVNIASGAKRTYRLPIAAIAPDGRWAVSISFGRLADIKPEYGYAGLRDPWAAERLPKEDGIWYLDLVTGEAKLVLPLSQIAATGRDGDADEAVHYLNHPLINTTSDRLCFVHRYLNRAGTQQTRMLSCRPDGSDLTLMIAGMASHAGWRNDHELLAWAGERKLLRSATAGSAQRLPIGKILKAGYRMLGKPAIFKSKLMNDRYILFDINDGSMRPVVQGVLGSDGHCSFSSDGEWFVTDTYPDRNGACSVYIVHFQSQRVFKVKGLYSPPTLDNEIRCDLHPRWHPTQPLVCVDSAHDGSRQMYEIDVSEVVRSMDRVAAAVHPKQHMLEASQ